MLESEKNSEVKLRKQTILPVLLFIIYVVDEGPVVVVENIVIGHWRECRCFFFVSCFCFF